MALAAVPMAGRCLSGVRRLRLLRREPVGVVAGSSVGEAVRGFGSLGGPGADATAIGAAGSVGTRGGVLGMAKVVGVAATAGARDGVLGVSSVDGAVGACDGGKLATLDIFVRVLRLVASRYVRTGDSSPPGTFATLRHGASADGLSSSRGAVPSRGAMSSVTVSLLADAGSASCCVENNRTSSFRAATWLVSRGGNGELGVGLPSAVARSLMLAEMRSSADGVGMVN